MQSKKERIISSGDLNGHNYIGFNERGHERIDDINAILRNY